MAGGGMIGLIIQADAITLYEGLSLLTGGLILWLMGIQKGDGDGN